MKKGILQLSFLLVFSAITFLTIGFLNPGKASAEEVLLEVVWEDLTVYQSATARSKIIGRLLQGNRVKADANAVNGFHRVSFEDGKYGYISERGIKIVSNEQPESTDPQPSDYNQEPQCQKWQFNGGIGGSGSNAGTTNITVALGIQHYFTCYFSALLNTDIGVFNGDTRIGLGPELRLSYTLENPPIRPYLGVGYRFDYYSVGEGIAKSNHQAPMVTGGVSYVMGNYIATVGINYMLYKVVDDTKENVLTWTVTGGFGF